MRYRNNTTSDQTPWRGMEVAGDLGTNGQFEELLVKELYPTPCRDRPRTSQSSALLRTDPSALASEICQRDPGQVDFSH